MIGTESGRRSRAIPVLATNYVAFLNSLQSLTGEDLASVEEWWVGRFVDHFNTEPFKLNHDTSRTFAVVIRNLLDRAIERQKKAPGKTCAGAMLKHSVGAKLSFAPSTNVQPSLSWWKNTMKSSLSMKLMQASELPLTDNLSSAQRSHAMRQVKGKKTKPELIVRAALRNLGHTGYRLHRRDIPGYPDIAWIGRKLAIFVNGCFWHGHDCLRGARVPKSNADYWLGKISRTVQRDTQNRQGLSAARWSVLTLWECELRDEGVLNVRLTSFLER